jgi:type II secretory pathway pseudopilin PulG
MDQDLPKAIQNELAQAEAIEKQLADEAASKVGNTEPAPEPTPTEPTEVPSEPKPAEEPKPAVDAEWKQRYDILQGKYNAEVPRLHDQLKSQGDVLQQLQHELEALKNKPAEPQQPKESLVTDKDEETFGSDLVDLARRVSRDEASQTLQRINMIENAIQQLMQLSQKVTAVETNQVQTAQDKFWTSIATAVPDWKEINHEAQWLSWLAEYDIVAGKTRQESLDEASQRLDADRVAGLFKLWKTQFRPAEPVKSNTDAELSRQVAPPKQGASSVPTQQKIWTGAEYERAYDPRLMTQMSADEVDSLQAEAERAVQEGRVRW